MIPDFNIKIEFNKTHSKFYREVINLCRQFEDFQEGDRNTLSSNRDEVYALWDQFNLIFWRTVDWKGSTISYNGSKWGSHTDKTRIFYAVQDNRLNHLCSVVRKIKNLGITAPPNISALNMLELCN